MCQGKISFTHSDHEVRLPELHILGIELSSIV